MLVKHMANPKRVWFRISAGSQLGMGHLVRCSHLAQALNEHDIETAFLIDQCLPQYQAWLGNSHVQSLYPEDNYQSQRIDAEHCCKYIGRHDWVIVDDYRLDMAWETSVAKTAQRVIAIDDLANRIHYCDVLLDYRNSKMLDRYEAILPKHCRKLLGPQFCLLGAEYRNTINRRPSTHDRFVIMVSLGGGGDFTLLHPIITKLLELPPQDFEIRVIAGAMSVNTQYLDALQLQHDHLSVIRNSNSLYNHYQCAHLFIGAAGTALYELNACELPALTFAISNNQNTVTIELEELGHYLHIPFHELQNIDGIKQLVKTAKSHYKRFIALCKTTTIKIDGLGAKRVASALLEQPLLNKKKSHHRSTCLVREYFFETLQPGITVAKVQDTDINHYLDARNLPENRDRMTVRQHISRIEHYNWWFNNDRHCYVLRKNGAAMLYIWHQLKIEKGQQYLIGGWFIANNDCGLELSALALEWQLQHCRKHHPDAIWLAIINKENKYVNLLNSMHGFTMVSQNSLEHEAIEKFFPMASSERFNYLACAPLRSTAV